MKGCERLFTVISLLTSPATLAKPQFVAVTANLNGKAIPYGTASLHAGYLNAMRHGSTDIIPA
ncbi:hypothetical protein [Microcoleus sp. FACHB-672]|uniref:hypothetical protein n=1 Tax=Microcoleus sp. FACHB-672 TaxID=2692825 RepID=UPI001686E557|nr:hypothetical protein [Microcoleus sp. FACHB-672]MBD2043243.1 hypothetical protein [Microcoleus sp. FACHB-672]